MTEPTPTLADLLVQQADVERQIAALTLTAVQSAKTVMDRTSTGKVADDLEALLPELPDNGVVRQQVGNVISIIRNVQSWLPQEVARLTALAAPVEEPAA